MLSIVACRANDGLFVISDSHNTYLTNDDAKHKYEAKVVVDEKTGEVVGRWIRTNADTYTVGVQDDVDVPRKGNKVVTYRASEGKGVVIAAGDKVNVREQAGTTSKIIGAMYNKEGELPDVFQCLGYKNGWFCIDFNGKKGYVSARFTYWDSICTF